MTDPGKPTDQILHQRDGRLSVVERSMAITSGQLAELYEKCNSHDAQLSRLFVRQEAQEERQTAQEKQIAALVDNGKAIEALIGVVRDEQALSASRHEETAQRFNRITGAIVDMTALITGATTTAQSAKDAVAVHTKKESWLTKATASSVGLWFALIGSIGLWLWQGSHLETALQHIVNLLRELRGAP